MASNTARRLHPTTSFTQMGMIASCYKRAFAVALIVMCLGCLLCGPSQVAFAASGATSTTSTYTAGTPVLKTAASDGGMSIYAIDLGNKHKGDAVVVKCGSELLLMDLGNLGAFSAIESVLDDLGAPKLGSSSSMKLSIYISHYHTDHIGGTLTASGSFQKVLNKYSVSNVYLPSDSIFLGKLDNTDVLERGNRMTTIAGSLQPKCKVVRLKKGSKFLIGAASAKVIGPVGVKGFTKPGKEPETPEENDEKGPWHNFINNCSLITKITYGKVSYLSTGDVREEGEAALVSTYGSALKSDILKLSHHGVSGNASDYLACVKPSYSFGTNNGFTTLREKETTDDDSGYKVRQTYSAKQEASLYGLCYMIGEEEDGFVVKTDGKKKLCYRYSNQSKALAGGIVSTVGSYGEGRGGGKYDFNDYYYLDKNGAPITGIKNVKVNGVKGLRLFESGGKLYTDAWGYDDSGKYAYTGWHTFGKYGTQYFNQKTAVMASGFTKIKGDTYYFSPDNYYCRALGMQKIGKDYYWFSDEAGKMIVNKWKDYNKKTKRMYFLANGKRASGWTTIQGSKYYFNPKTGYGAVDVTKIGSKCYWFTDAGKMITNKWKDYNKKTKRMYFQANGQRASGWTTIKGSKYYFDPKTGYGAIGLTQVGSRYYYFRDTGTALTKMSKWIDGYLCNFDKNGVLTNAPVPAKLTMPKVTASGESNLKVSWNNKNAAVYEVYMSTSKTGTYTKVATAKKASQVTFSSKKLKAKKTYYFKVRSYNTALGTSFYSDYSAATAFKVA